VPVFRKAVDRLADLLRSDRGITYRAFLDVRTAPYVTPLLDKIVADDADGEALRNSLIPWRRAERPPLAIYHGDVSTCRIDGPWQVAGKRWLPLGGLIVSPGVTVHLNPFEAQALHRRMQQVIEDTIRAWVREHDLRGRHRGPEEIDRTVADPAAKAMIAAWAFGQREADTMPDANPGDRGEALCALCRKGVGHA
jgi:hypothetical protein